MQFCSMKKVILFSITGILYSFCAVAQSTGNVIYNSNNRFYQNSNYRNSSSGYRYISAAPQVSYDASAKEKGMGISGFMSGFSPASNEVIININVLYNAKPTGYMAIFHINQAGKKISDLDTMVSRRVNKFMDMAKTLGIGRENFYTDMIALVPIFEQSKRNTTKPKGFELQKNLHVKYTEPSQLDKLFSIAAQCEIYDLIKVEYLYGESEKAGAEMHTKALQLLKNKTDYYSKLGVKLDTAYKTIYESGSVTFPIDKYTQYTPLSVSSLDDEDKPSSSEDLMKTAQGIIQHRTVFYNPTDCSGFDAVMNPNPLEPPVQFTYSLQVRYKMAQPVVVKTEKTVEKQHEILIVTPGGEVKTILK